ncbi:DUF4307 domain-containing protein [Dermacoccaceae bacterium W4C1]
MPFTMPTGRNLMWWVIGTVGVAIGVVLATIWGVSATRGVSWESAGHHVVDDRTIQVRYNVIDGDRQPIECTVRALASDHSVVGRTTVTFPASKYDSTRHVTVVKTTHRATTGEVEGCTALGG